MNTRDQFGNYLLLKRLSEDALGETYRAGRIAKGALERVVLLRVLNGQGFDGERIARALQARSALPQALKSPNIGQPIDVGQVRGVPYVAYDYVSGRSLAQLLEQAGRRSNPMPLDHALLIAERIALALAVAFEVKLGDERVQHGFVTPQMVQVTNEGELKLVGFEASTGLRESAAHPLIKQAIGRYLAPESLAGQAPARADDVYSLGALLFEMITGQLVPMMPPGGHGAILDQVVVAAEGSHLPADVAALLKRTLCPRDQRVPDVVTWHKSLAKLMADGGYAATTFNLAFFLHSLFRDEIDREPRELDSEKSQAEAMIAAAAAPVPAPAPAPIAPMAATAGSVRTSGPVRDESAVLREEYGLPTKSGGGNKNVLIAAGVGAVAVLGVVGYLLLGKGGDAAATPAATAPPAATTAAPAAAPAATGMTPEQIQALITQALEQQRKEIAAGQKASDDQLKALQQQLENAQRVRASSGSTPAPSTSAVAPTVAEVAPAPEPVAEIPAPADAQPARVEPMPEKPAPVASTQIAASQPKATPSAPPPAPAASAPASSGDALSIGPGVTPPRIVRQPPLNYPPVAKRLKKEAVVGVRVLVDENGRVADAQTSTGKAGFGMDEAALAYARSCQFEPARKGGVKVKVWYEIKVAFKL